MWESRRSLRAQIEKLEAGLRDYGERILELERLLNERDEVLRSHGLEARTLADVIAASSAGIERRRDNKTLRSYVSAAGALVGYSAWFLAGAFGGLEAGELTEEMLQRLRVEHPVVFRCVDRVEHDAAATLGALDVWDAETRNLQVFRVELSGDGYELSGRDRHDAYDLRAGPDPDTWRVTAGGRDGPTRAFEIRGFVGATALEDAVAYLESQPDEAGTLAVPVRGEGPLPRAATLLRRQRLSSPGV